MSIWITFILAGLATYLTRLSLIWIVGHREVPVWLQQSLRYVPPAVLTAIIFPEIFIQDSVLILSPVTNARVIAGVIAALIAWKSRSVLLTIGIGMLALWLTQAML